jgi:hypothetical protein
MRRWRPWTDFFNEQHTAGAIALLDAPKLRQGQRAALPHIGSLIGRLWWSSVNKGVA